MPAPGPGHNQGPALGDSIEEDLAQELRGEDREDLLREAHKELLVLLTAKLKAGTATHQELAILRNLLRDNGMVIPPRPPEAERRDAQRPRADLPVLDDPDYED